MENVRFDVMRKLETQDLAELPTDMQGTIAELIFIDYDLWWKIQQLIGKLVFLEYFPKRSKIRDPI